MNRLMVLTGALLVAIGFLTLLAGRLSLPASDQPSELPSAKAREASTSHFAREDDIAIDPTLIHRDSSGQFRIDARVNGTESRFLVDTGADAVVMTVASAQEAGLPVDTSAFQPIVRTASGEGKGARYTAQDFEIAGRSYHNVEIIVVEGLAVNLLGQSLLSRIGGVTIKGDAMVLGKAE